MMRVLLIKTSSMGDLIHTLPALTDAKLAFPHLSFDWVVEDIFAEIPAWHTAVSRALPVSLRRWRKELVSKRTIKALLKLRSEFHQEQYDIILDAQGLIKSAWLCFFAKGRRVGLDWQSAREPLASLAYQHKCDVNFHQHAVHRMRKLFSQALNYPFPHTEANFGINKRSFLEHEKIAMPNYLVFLHGTSWHSKLWPETYWVQLAKLSAEAGYKIKISGGNAEEILRAYRIAAACEAVEVYPFPSINEMAKLLANSKGAVAVDTGFGHLAAAMGVPTVSLYGPTNPDYTGALGAISSHLRAQFPCSPCFTRSCQYQGESKVKPACFEDLTPAVVFRTIQHNISQDRT